MVIDKKKSYYLTQMGIEQWRPREELMEKQITSQQESKPQEITTSSALSQHPPEQEWSEFQSTVKNCTKCALHATRTHVVFGVGDPKADLMIVGEAPGAQEDRQGEPFVGRAGQLLNNMLKAIELKREAIFIANILKCRPPNNRDPKPEEVAQCTPYLEQQLAHIKPKLILAVGRIAAHFLLQQKTSLSRLRGQEFSYGTEKTPLMVTYHPAYLLRNPNDKSKSYEDLLRVQDFLKRNNP
ncbi:MAG: uracil-DNA glycosylase [Gammaproteobacteria bacterium]